MGTVTRTTERFYLGTYCMRIEAVGADMWSGASNAIDVDGFVGGVMLSCWLSASGLVGASSVKAEVHFLDAAKVDLGGPVVWGTLAQDEAGFIQFIHQVKRVDMPVGTRFLTLRFGVVNDIETGEGIGYVDAVQAAPGDALPAWTPSSLTEHSTLDDVPNGTIYGRVLNIALSAGYVDLSSAGIKNRGALALLDIITSVQLAKNCVVSNNIAAGAVTLGKINAGAVDTAAIADLTITGGKLAVGAVGSTQLAASAVGATQLANSVSSLTRVTGGILTASGSTATLPTGKILNASAGKVKLRTFTSMPTMSVVDDGEWFAVTAGLQMGIYVRVGTTAMNGSGVTSNMSS
ncbi:MAG: hypothetical protein Q8O14_14460 [bacterium]|nr:hypothetical protein [bacterium]